MPDDPAPTLHCRDARARDTARGAEYVHELPAGFRLRHPTMADLPAVAGLHAAASVTAIGRVTTRAADLRVRWIGRDETDELVLVEHATDPYAPAAFASFETLFDPWTDALDLHVELVVHPDVRGRGLGGFLLERATRRARLAAEAHGVTTVLLRSSVVDGDAATNAFYATRGFVAIRHLLELRMDLHAAPPRPAWPPGITLRSFHPGSDEHALWQAHRQAFVDVATHQPLGIDDFLDTRIRHDPGFDPGLVLLAMDGSSIAGLAVCRAGTEVAAEDGWVRDLGVVPSWRRRGVGMALLRAAFAAFRARGLTGVALEVDDVTLEGAAALYRRAGMRVLRRTDVVERPLTLPRTSG